MRKVISLMMSLLMIFSFMTPYTSAETENGGYAAIVDYVATEDGCTKTYFSDYESELGTALYIFYTQDPDFEYDITKNGQSADVSDIEEGDILNFYYDTDYELDEVYELKVDISDKLLNGQVEGLEEGVSCIVDGETYELAMGAYVSVGKWYNFSLDSRDRIVMAEEDYTKNNYAVVDRVFLDSDEGCYKARLILFDGTRKVFGFTDSNVAEDMLNFTYTDSDCTELADLRNRFIEYNTDENGNIDSFSEKWMRLAEGEYKSDYNQIKNIIFSENTKILDLTYVYGHESYYDSDITVFPLSAFKDESLYTLLASETDYKGNTIFAAVIRTETDIQTDSPFAVVEKTDISSIPNKIYLTTGDGISKEYKVNSDISLADYEHGDLVSFVADNRGRLTDIALINKTSEILENNKDEYVDFFEMSQNTGILEEHYYKYYESGIAPWDGSRYFDDRARYSFGVVRNIGDGLLSISDVKYEDVYYDEDGYEEYYEDYHVYYTYDYELTDSPNIVVWDKTDNTIKSGTISDILPMYGAKEGGALLDYAMLPGYAFIKTYNDVVTDIYYIKPDISPADYEELYEDYDAFELGFTHTNGLTLEISDIFPTFKNKTLYVCTYNDGRLTDIQDTTIEKAVLTFKNAKPEDTVKAFIMGDNLEPMSIPVEDIIGEALSVNVLPAGESDRTLKFSSNEVKSFSNNVIKLSNPAYTSKAIDRYAKFFINGYLTEENPEYILSDYPDVQCTISDNNGDRKYDIFRMEVGCFAVVEDIINSEDHVKLIFSQCSPELRGYIDIYKDNYHEYKIVKDDAEILPSDIKAGDVLNLYYDITKSFEESKSVLIKVLDTPITGIVTSRYRDSNDRCVYVINGEEYTYAFDCGYYELVVGYSYTLYVDENNRIITFEEDAVSKNYGIIDRVWKDSSDNNKVRFITPEGTRETYTIKRSEVDYAYDITYEDGYNNGYLNMVENRIVSYKINSQNEVYGIDQISIIAYEGIYKKNTNRILTAKMNEDTAVIDLSADVDWNDTDSYSKYDLKAGSLNSFQDGEEYIILAGDKSSSGISRVVVITRAPNGITVDAPFAVVDSVTETVVDGSERYAFNLYTAESGNEIVSFYVDEDEAVWGEDFTRGDVIAYSLSDSGEIKNITQIFSVFWFSSNGRLITFDDALEIFDYCDFPDPTGMYDDWFIQSGVDSWDNSHLMTNKGFARIGFGAIVDKSLSTLTLAQFVEANEEFMGYDSYGDENVIAGIGDIVSCGNDINEMDVADDVNVYVYDFNKRDNMGSGRLKSGNYTNVIKSSVPSSLISEDLDGEYVYNWTQIFDYTEIYPNFAFYKALNNEITDIFVIIPSEY